MHMIPERWQQVKDVLLAALDLPALRREAYLDNACGDQTLRQEVESLLLEQKNGTEEFLRSPVDFSLEDVQRRFRLPPGKHIGAYEILEEIAVGGMGAVYRAVRADGQYKQQVALKIVRSELGSEFTTGRFRNERQILASLNHPNIAKILDGGATAEGVLYLVMELVEGERLDEYCDAHKLATTERLNLFLQICAAVQYAHQRLIVHRDIKPGNILVNAEGVPKLLDFGIAKILESSQANQPEQTISLVPLLTPEYASPEQIKGEPITTASDVYSLGVVLYELLTGCAPYNVPTHTPHELSRAVCETEPERPSMAVLRKQFPANEGERGPDHEAALPAMLEGSPERLSKRLDGDLDNIILMALRKEPQRRYASVEQFAQDIRRHLDHLPVIARKDTFGYRTSKFITRHKAGVIVAALVTVALLSATGITIRQARIARAERARAERRFNDVRKLANSLIFEVHDAIQDLPGSTPARKLIAAKAVEYLDSLAQESQYDPNLQRELAAGYRRIGEVESANFRDPASALADLKKALAIRQALVARRDTSLDDLVEYAQLTRELAKTSLGASDLVAALNADKQTAQILESASSQHPDNVQILYELMLNYSSQADILAGSFSESHMGDVSAAIQPSRRELQLAQELCDLQPSNLDFRRELAASLGELGDELYASGQGEEASHDFAESQKILDDLVSVSPTPKVRKTLYDSYYRMVPMKISHGDIPGAIGDARHLVEISTQLSQDDPQDTLPRLLLAAAYANLANALSRTQDRDSARAAITSAMSTDAELVRTHSNNQEFREMQAERFRDAGDIFIKLGALERALQYYEQAVAFFLPAQAKDAQDAGRRHSLAGAYDGLGSALAALHRPKDAEEAYRNALGLSGFDNTSGGADEEALYQNADAYTGLAEVETILAADAGHDRVQTIKHWQNARRYLERSLQVWSHVPRPMPQSPEGHDCIPPAVVAQRLAKCTAALASEQAGSQR
jgi:serine/threonine protein kinase/tetratricopeptide (TPR) repeat protein